MENLQNRIEQWHSTRAIEEKGVLYFLKLYKPDSYEIKNEIGWLTSAMIKSCKSFDVPNIIDASVKEGYVKMDYINILDGKSREEITDYLIECAMELHSLIKADQPQMKTPVSRNDYNSFLADHVKVRTESIKTEFDLPTEIIDWINSRVQRLQTDYFSIVHRDLRARHLLFSKDKKPSLIDWEFSNISDPAQDLAKIIYDGTLGGLNYNELRKKVIDVYSHEKNISQYQLEERVMTFAPIIPLENSMALINRKPAGYEQEVLKDLCYIKTLYEENR